MEIGNRLGLQLEDVSFPGYFLVKRPSCGGVAILDVYAGGTLLSATIN